MRLVFAREMEPFAAEFTTQRPDVSESDLSAFAQAWNRESPAISRRITGRSILDLSRWAIDETRGFQPPTGWLDKIPMRPLRSSENGQSVLFGPAAQEGLSLPVHRGPVHRRLQTFAVYDRESRAIPTVYVTIRGWVEE